MKRSIRSNSNYVESNKEGFYSKYIYSDLLKLRHKSNKEEVRNIGFKCCNTQLSEEVLKKIERITKYNKLPKDTSIYSKCELVNNDQRDFQSCGCAEQYINRECDDMEYVIKPSIWSNSKIKEIMMKNINKEVNQCSRTVNNSPRVNINVDDLKNSLEQKEDKIGRAHV